MNDMEVLVDALSRIADEDEKERSLEDRYHDLQDICDDQAKRIQELEALLDKAKEALKAELKRKYDAMDTSECCRYVYLVKELGDTGLWPEIREKHPELWPEEACSTPK
jgi:hypothetical protein